METDCRRSVYALEGISPVLEAAECIVAVCSLARMPIEYDVCDLSPLPFSQDTDNIYLGRAGIGRWKEVNHLELLAESGMLVGREGLCLFRNLVVVGCSLFRCEPSDEIGIAITRLWLATCWHGDGVECLVAV